MLGVKNGGTTFYETLFLTSNRTFWPHGAVRTPALCGRTVRSNFFIGFLDELDNSKHFETYLFFAHFRAISAQCGGAVPHSAAAAVRYCTGPKNHHSEVRQRPKHIKSDFLGQNMTTKKTPDF